jgi:hypothetical protein
LSDGIAKKCIAEEIDALCAQLRLLETRLPPPTQSALAFKAFGLKTHKLEHDLSPSTTMRRMARSERIKLWAG